MKFFNFLTKETNCKCDCKDEKLQLIKKFRVAITNYMVLTRNNFTDTTQSIEDIKKAYILERKQLLKTLSNLEKKIKEGK